jgi:hypothetical protein
MLKRSYPYPIATGADSVEYLIGESGGALMQFGSADVAAAISADVLTEISADVVTTVAAGSRRVAASTFSAQTAVSLPLTAYTGYRGFRFVFTRVTLATGSADFFIRTSTDGGSNYDSGATDYSYSAPFFSTAAGFSHSMGDDCIRFASWLSDAGYFELDITVWNPSVASADGILFKGDFSFADSAGSDQFTGLVSGTRLANADVDAISINCDASTMSGNYVIYGLY